MAAVSATFFLVVTVSHSRISWTYRRNQSFSFQSTKQVASHASVPNAAK
jgi:hypothetical protein